MVPKKHIEKGIHLCIENAKRLLLDSEKLFISNRLPTAITCVILSNEEIGKAIILRDKLREGKDISSSFLEKLQKEHVLKSRRAEDFTLRKMLKMKEDLNKQVNDYHAKMTNVFKNRFLYVNWKNGKWESPTDLTEKYLILLYSIHRNNAETTIATFEDDEKEMSRQLTRRIS